MLVAISFLLSCNGNSLEKWKNFSTENTSYRLPPRWIVFDPYKIKNLYWTYQWFRYFPPNDCRMALFKSPPADQTQFFTIIGPKETLEGPLNNCLTKYNNDATIESICRHEYSTSNGIKIELFKANKKSSRFDAEPVSYFIGFGEFGDSIFILNGGARLPRLDMNIIKCFIESLELSEH
ncbi:hypothetical protein KAH81_00905 [bacterium]|nr:hypothetical protein [bacterium]